MYIETVHADNEVVKKTNVFYEMCGFDKLALFLTTMVGKAQRYFISKI